MLTVSRRAAASMGLSPPTLGFPSGRPVEGGAQSQGQGKDTCRRPLLSSRVAWGRLRATAVESVSGGQMLGIF